MNSCECCNSPRCWLKISYSYALEPSIHVVILSFRPQRFRLAGQRQMSRPLQGFVKLTQSVSLSNLHRNPCSRGSDSLGCGFKEFALLRPLRFTPDSSSTDFISLLQRGDRLIKSVTQRRPTALLRIPRGPGTGSYAAGQTTKQRWSAQVYPTVTWPETTLSTFHPSSETPTIEPPPLPVPTQWDACRRYPYNLRARNLAPTDFA